MWKFYKIMSELPRPPQHFFDAVQIDPDNLPSRSPYHDIVVRYTTRNGQKFMASPLVRTKFSDEFEQWVRENITPKFMDAGVSYRYCNSDTSGVHTDHTRDFVLSYNITNGGPKCGLVYWKNKDREGEPLFQERGIQHLNFDNLEKLDELTGPDDTWFLLETNIIHSVENIETPRVQFQVSLRNEDMPAEWLADHVVD
jgi:hypothetical protein